MAQRSLSPALDSDGSLHLLDYVRDLKPGLGHWSVKQHGGSVSFLHHRGVLGCVGFERGGWGCVWKCVCASRRPQCAACLTWLHPDLLAQTSKHEPLLLHTGKINHLLDSWGHLRFSLVPAALKELGCRGKCVCVCVCPLGGTAEVIVVDKDLKWSRWRTRQNCEQLSLFVRVSRSLTCSLPALC